MSNFKSKILNELHQKGYIKDIINPLKLDEILNSEQKICLYCGFDLTGDSLHVGHLIPINILKTFHKYGHKIIIILGEATTKIGDPSGKDETRKMQTNEQIEVNKQGIIKSLEKFIKKDKNVLYLNNNDWTAKMTYVDFLREVGAFFSVNKMLSLESVKLRLEREQNMNFIEFNYVLMQSFDFYHLFKNYNCCLQIGGSEQWGNIVNGIELINKKTQKRNDIFGITMNLVTRSDGKKMGKTESGAVWLNEDKMSPYEYFQYFRNVDDRDVKKFFLLFTDLNDNQISEIEKKEINEQKKDLAFEITKLCHGETEANKTLNRSISEFEQGVATEKLEFKIQNNENIVDVLMHFNLFSSRGECKKSIRAGGVKINSEQISEDLILTKGEFLVFVGKKKFFVLKVL